MRYSIGTNVPIFQSTLPARGATLETDTQAGRLSFQSTLPARGATCRARRRAPRCRISIHAPRTGSDFCRRLPAPRGQYFNPRSPHGERPSLLPVSLRRWYFNPRSPHGERLRRRARGDCRGGISIHAPRTGSDIVRYSIGTNVPIFQSTLPARGATSVTKRE